MSREYIYIFLSVLLLGFFFLPEVWEIGIPLLMDGMDGWMVKTP